MIDHHHRDVLTFCNALSFKFFFQFQKKKVVFFPASICTYVVVFGASVPKIFVCNILWLFSSRSSHQTFFKGAEHVDISTGSTLEYGKKVSRDLDAVSNIRSNVRLSIPAKSAPASGFSSPVLSPRRMSMGDFFPTFYMSSQAKLQFWSDQAFPTSDTIFSAHASPEKFMVSPERSPLHSPRTRTPGPKSPSGAATPMHPKMSPENSAAWHDNNGIITTHPLPLPPGAAVSPQGPQPTLVHQPTAKPEASLMISQWQKTKLIGSGTFGNVYVASNRYAGILADSVACSVALSTDVLFLSTGKQERYVL